MSTSTLRRTKTDAITGRWKRDGWSSRALSMNDLGTDCDRRRPHRKPRSHARTHALDHRVAELGARHLGGALHQAGEVVGHDLVADGGFHRLDDEVGGFLPAQVAQHHLGREDQRDRVHLVLPAYLGAVPWWPRSRRTGRRCWPPARCRCRRPAPPAHRRCSRR